MYEWAVGRQLSDVVANINEHLKQVRRKHSLEQLSIPLHAKQISGECEESRLAHIPQLHQFHHVTTITSLSSKFSYK